MQKITVSPINDFALIVYGLEGKTSLFLSLLERKLKTLLLDFVPAYSSLVVYYDILSISYEDLAKEIENLWRENKSSLQNNSSKKRALHLIPTYYGAEVGWDLEEIAKQKNITISKIIELHSKFTYEVFAIGFRPGFAYMGNLNEALCLDRKKNPRTAIPKGSVAIAHQQTAIYPNTGPGGWNIIGKTYLDLVDWQKESPCLLQVGDRVQFSKITKEEFLSGGGKIGS